MSHLAKNIDPCFYYLIGVLDGYTGYYLASITCRCAPLKAHSPKNMLNKRFQNAPELSFSLTTFVGFF